MRNLLILGSAIFALATAGMTLFGQAGAAWAGPEAGHEHAIEQSQTFNVEKMTCATCPITVKKAMQRVDGVKSVKVDLDSKTAVAVYDPSVTTVDKIAAASTDVGFPAEVAND